MLIRGYGVLHERNLFLGPGGAGQPVFWSFAHRPMPGSETHADFRPTTHHPKPRRDLSKAGNNG